MNSIDEEKIFKIDDIWTRRLNKVLYKKTLITIHTGRPWTLLPNENPRYYTLIKNYYNRRKEKHLLYCCFRNIRLWAMFRLKPAHTLQTGVSSSTNLYGTIYYTLITIYCNWRNIYYICRYRNIRLWAKPKCNK